MCACGGYEIFSRKNSLEFRIWSSFLKFTFNLINFLSQGFSVALSDLRLTGLELRYDCLYLLRSWIKGMNHHFWLIFILYLCECLHVCICTVWVSGECKGQKATPDSLNLELQAVVSWVTGSCELTWIWELNSARSLQEKHILSVWAISLA